MAVPHSIGCMVREPRRRAVAAGSAQDRPVASRVCVWRPAPDGRMGGLRPSQAGRGRQVGRRVPRRLASLGQRRQRPAWGRAGQGGSWEGRWAGILSSERASLASSGGGCGGGEGLVGGEAERRRGDKAGWLAGGRCVCVCGRDGRRVSSQREGERRGASREV